MIYSFLYVVIASFGTVFIEKLFASISPFFSLLITATIATLFFNIVNIGKLQAIYRACWQEKNLCFAIMITILVMWSCAMSSPGLIGASLYSFLYFCWLGMIGFLSLSIIDWKNNYKKFYFFIATLLLIILSVWSVLEHAFLRSEILGIILALCGGTSAFVYFKQSQALIKRIKLSATQILAMRFYLTIFVIIIFLPKGSFSLYFSPFNLMQLTILSLITLIVPLYFQQKALERISSEQNAIIMSLTPVVTAFIQELAFRNVDLKFIVVYLLYSVIVASSYLVNKHKIVGEKS